MKPRTSIFRMLVREAMAGIPACGKPDSPMADIVRAMAEGRNSGVVITDALGRPQGIITEHDITRRALSRPNRAPPHATS